MDALISNINTYLIQYNNGDITPLMLCYNIKKDIDFIETYYKNKKYNINKLFIQKNIDKINTVISKSIEDCSKIILDYLEEYKYSSLESIIHNFCKSLLIEKLTNEPEKKNEFINWYFETKSVLNNFVSSNEEYNSLINQIDENKQLYLDHIDSIVGSLENEPSIIENLMLLSSMSEEICDYVNELKNSDFSIDKKYEKGCEVIFKKYKITIPEIEHLIKSEVNVNKEMEKVNIKLDELSKLFTTILD